MKASPMVLLYLGFCRRCKGYVSIRTMDSILGSIRMHVSIIEINNGSLKMHYKQCYLMFILLQIN